MEQEYPNDVRSNMPADPNQDSDLYIHIRIPKRRIKKFLSLAVPLLLVLSLLMNFMLLHALARTRFSRRVHTRYSMPAQIAVPGIPQVPEVPQVHIEIPQIEAFSDDFEVYRKEGKFNPYTDEYFWYYDEDDTIPERPARPR